MQRRSNNGTLSFQHPSKSNYYVFWIIFLLIWISITLLIQFNYISSLSLKDLNNITTSFRSTKPKTTTLQTIVINLDSRPEKWQNVLRDIKSSSILSKEPYTRVSATYGPDLDLLSLYESGKLSSVAYRSLLQTRRITGTSVTIGALGCALSHIRVWEAIVSSNVSTLVLEDDATLNPVRFDSVFPQALNNLPPTFGMLYFIDLINNTATRKSSKEYSPILERIYQYYWGTFAYYVNPATAKSLLKNAFPITKQIDTYIISHNNNTGTEVYRTREAIVNTDNDQNRTSDVQVVKDFDDVVIPPNLCTNVYIIRAKTSNEREVTSFASDKIEHNFNTKLDLIHPGIARHDFTIEVTTSRFSHQRSANLLWQLEFFETKSGIMLLNPQEWNTESFTKLFKKRFPLIMKGAPNGFIAFREKSHRDSRPTSWSIDVIATSVVNDPRIASLRKWITEQEDTSRLPWDDQDGLKTQLRRLYHTVSNGSRPIMFPLDVLFN